MPASPAPASPPAAQQWRPADALANLAPRDGVSLNAVLEAFADDLGVSMPLARQAVASGDCQALATLACRWRYSLGLLRAAAAQREAAALEAHCLAQRSESLADCYWRLARLLSEMREIIRGHLQEAQR